MSYATICRIRATWAREGLTSAVAMARGYGVTDPADFLAYCFPGVAFKVRQP